MILAPLRGVTIRCFRETFAEEIAACGFTEAVTPFIPAMPGLDPMRNEELGMKRESGEQWAVSSGQGAVDREQGAVDRGQGAFANSSCTIHHSFKLTPQFIGKDPGALRTCLERVKAAGFDTADLNAGCPFPMVRNKGRGCGMLRTPDVLRRMLEVGCEVMGEGKFSLKTRLGVERTDELLGLMPMINLFPLRFLTVHARTARQMYEGRCDVAALRRVEEVAAVPVVENGDLEMAAGTARPRMVGRAFVRYLGTREDAAELARRYIAASERELHGDRPVLGRMKELISYWKDLPGWRRKWESVKICRSVDELRMVI